MIFDPELLDGCAAISRKPPCSVCMCKNLPAELERLTGPCITEMRDNMFAVIVLYFEACTSLCQTETSRS